MRWRNMAIIGVLFVAGIVGVIAGVVFRSYDEGPSGRLVERSRSPDGLWEVRIYHETTSGLNNDAEYVEARSIGSEGQWRQLYYGEPAEFRWRDGDEFVAAQLRSKRVVVIDVDEGQVFDQYGTNSVWWAVGVGFAVFAALVLPGVSTVLVISHMQGRAAHQR